MKDRAAGEYKSVRALSRGLELLRLLSTAHAGRAAAAELSKTSGIHRTTVRRILETLADEGYLARSPSDDSFRLAAKVTQLGHGFSDAHCASIAALPVLDQLVIPGAGFAQRLDQLQRDLAEREKGQPGPRWSGVAQIKRMGRLDCVGEDDVRVWHIQ